jgi:hypothetical protein
VWREEERLWRDSVVEHHDAGVDSVVIIEVEVELLCLPTAGGHACAEVAKAKDTGNVVKDARRDRVWLEPTVVNVLMGSSADGLVQPTGAGEGAGIMALESVLTPGVEHRVIGKIGRILWLSSKDSLSFRLHD